MSIEEKLKDLSKYAQMHIVQLSLSALLSFVCGFALSSSLADPCVRSIVCEDIIEDRDKLSDQLDNSRQECLDQKADLGKSLKKKFDKSCEERVTEATANCEFSERHHCAICRARGVCR